MNVGYRERNQQDATNLTFIVKLLPQHVSDIIIIIFSLHLKLHILSSILILSLHVRLVVSHK